MKRGTMPFLLLWLCLALVPCAFAAEAPSDQTIIAFIVQHSPRIREAQALLPTPGNLLKIEARGRVLLPNAGLEGQGVGVVASLPLLDRREKAERTLKVLEVEREVQREAAALLQELRALQAQVRLGEELLKEMDEQLQWTGRRVREGVEYQKEANHFLLELYGKKVEIEQRRAQIGSLIEKLAGLIPPAQQPTLRAMLNGS
ncbi:hypothetical protein [Candidatus Methylomirabilis sp.]|uniref:hypothetical protein n=1 Tax=Candidatus Methylomirabilis sp. TaxID=2032687 RepID=UPI002A660330|nr:hypothetical protein [Candidatus Methylomirabilis sp.]